MTTSKTTGRRGSRSGGSFRDPGGVLRFIGGDPWRFVRPSHIEDLSWFVSSDVGRTWVESGRLVSSTQVDASALDVGGAHAEAVSLLEAETFAGIWRHERIEFPSFAEEWSAGMLHDAGALTLDLALALLDEGYGLKDATPSNVLFRGSQPVFIDHLSIERRDPGDPIWLPYAQFVRTFLLPLLVTRETGLPLRSAFTVGREGIEPEVARRLLPLTSRLRGVGFWHVTAPLLFSGGKSHDAAAGAPVKRSVPREQARYVLRRLFKQLRKALDAASPHANPSSNWTDYVEAYHSKEYFDAKRAWVTTAVEAVSPTRVLDIGCNTGELSLIATARGASVIGIDNDAEVVERLFQRARIERLDIQPLVVDLAAPTPARGWMNEEAPSFLSRAEGRFDLVLAMAVIHHLLATNGIPLAAIVEMFALLTTDGVALEFVPPHDPLFRRLARGRDSMYEFLTRSVFERACEQHFDILRAESLPSGDRVGYVLRKRGQ